MKRYLVPLLVSVCWGFSAFPLSGDSLQTLVNPAHLEHLYEEMSPAGESGAFVHIYAEYPDYRPVEAPGEGIACVDDVSRAAIFYVRHYLYTGQGASLNKARQLLRFILNMQAPNGMFYNFILADRTINRTRANSRPIPDWWTWRAFWAMSEAWPVFRKTEPEFAGQLEKSIRDVLPAVDSLVQHYPAMHEIEDLEAPAWLPSGGAADQGAVLLLGLTAYYSAGGGQEVPRQIRRIAEGLMKMQIDRKMMVPFGLFRSWPDRWHAWGNSQAEALLRAGRVLKERSYIESAQLEVKIFYPYLINHNYFREIRFAEQNRSFETTDFIKFPQIAYDIRPMVMASLATYDLTGDEYFARQAGEIACWLLGRNPADQLIYNPLTGRCFDGIISPGEVNQNSGAESTIEALLTILAVEQNPIAQKSLHDFYRQRTK